MGARIAIAAFSIVGVASSALAEPQPVDRVELTLSAERARVPSIVGLEVRFLDAAGEVIPLQQLDPTWNVVVTREGAPISLPLAAVRATATLEGDLPIRRSGRQRYGVRLEDHGVVVAESDPLVLDAVAPVDFGVVRAGETVCRQLPGGGRGLSGRVVEGSLPEGLRLWGGCLVAADDVAEASGEILAEIVTQQGRSSEPRLYEIRFRAEPRLLTPTRTFAGFLGVALLAMALAVGLALRRRRETFGPGAALAWAEVSGSPYRGERQTDWRVVPLDGSPQRRGVVDVGALLGGVLLPEGMLRVRPGADGLVEIVAARGEMIRAVTPAREIESGRRLAVPYGSMISFRDLALTPLIGDDASAGAPSGPGPDRRPHAARLSVG